MLDHLYEQVLHEYQIPHSGKKAEDIAARLIKIYEAGVRDIEMLKKVAIRS